MTLPMGSSQSVSSTKTPFAVRDDFKIIKDPDSKDVCCICFFNYAEIKRSGNKYHVGCYDSHLRTHSPPPEYLVKKNRSKE